ncbi:uncharacterized protein METZ01_LOCUS66065 [marine metagenome]|uniref:Uncharacterized protein n=1 Tax=marine metagenome TaxID=408172 RepID=A0A381TCH5_9ZZZZ
MNHQILWRLYFLTTATAIPPNVQGMTFDW